jgi:hypothetical protein
MRIPSERVDGVCSVTVCSDSNVSIKSCASIIVIAVAFGLLL